MTHQSKGFTMEGAIAPNNGDNAGLTDEQVAGFLRLHPDFLARQPDLLKAMTPPARWSDDVVVDMQQYMVELLRGEIEGLRDCTHEVIETSRCNMACQSRTHSAVLALLAASDLDTMLRTVSDDLPILLDVDVAVIGFEPMPSLDKRPAEISRLAAGDVDRLIGHGQDVVLIRDMSDDGTVFASAAGLVRSAALARVRPGSAAQGLLALGSRRDDAFHPGQGTELFRFLARIVEECLKRLLLSPA